MCGSCRKQISTRAIASHHSLMRGSWVSFICVTLWELVHRVVINFCAVSCALVCLRKTKIACIHGVSSFPHSSVVLPLFHCALFNITHSLFSRPSSNPHSWDVVVSVTPSAVWKGSLAQPSLNKWNQSQKQLAPGEGGGFGNKWGDSGRKYWWWFLCVHVYTLCVNVRTNAWVCVCGGGAGWWCGASYHEL